jgi:hypothetical protein
MRRLLVALALLPSLSFATPFDLLLNQRNIADTATILRQVASPGIGSTGVLITQRQTGLPVLYTLNNSFMIDDNTKTVASASDWSNVTNRPIFATVALTGDYNDLINKPSGAGQVNADWNAVSGMAEILNKPALAAVATSGSYADLIDEPVIPAPQVNSDWSASAGLSQILNKPTTLSGFGITDAYPLSGNPSGFLTAITSGQVTGALGFTPYSSANPSAFVSAAGARTAISLTTTGTTGAATYNNSTGVLNVPNYAAGTGTVTSVTAGTGLSGGTITTSGTISLPNVGSPSTYSTVTTDSQGRVFSGTPRSQASATRTLNTGFQVSSSRDALGIYSVQCTITANIAGGQACDIILEIASDSGFTANVQTVGIAGTGQTYTLAVAIQGVQPQTVQLSGMIPAGYYARLRTVNVSGSPTYSFRAAQEILL